MLKKSLLVFGLLILFAGCTDGDTSVGGGDTDTPAGDPSDGGRAVTTDCGIVSEGVIQNPISTGKARIVQAEIVASNRAILTLPEGSVLLKFQGIGSAEDFLAGAAVTKLKDMIPTGRALYYQAQPGCTTITEGGGIAQVGQLVSIEGQSLSEELIRSGYASVDAYDACGGELIGSCYEALRESSVSIDGVVSNFLWKPVSDSNGMLVVLLNPAGATVVVNGTALRNVGPSNGRGTTARGDKSGCSFGSNVKVRVYSQRGGIILFPNGEAEYTIPNGCTRYEF